MKKKVAQDIYIAFICNNRFGICSCFFISSSSFNLFCPRAASVDYSTVCSQHSEWMAITWSRFFWFSSRLNKYHIAINILCIQAFWVLVLDCNEEYSVFNTLGVEMVFWWKNKTASAVKKIRNVRSASEKKTHSQTTGKHFECEFLIFFPGV